MTDYDDTLVNSGFGEDGVLGAFSKGRGLGDCGDATEWAWNGRRFNLVRRAFMDDCLGVPSRAYGPGYGPPARGEERRWWSSLQRSGTESNRSSRIISSFPTRLPAGR